MNKYLLLLLAFFIATCSNNNKEPVIKEIEFVPEMLGLTPGSTIAEVNFAWYSDRAGNSFVRITKNGTIVSTEKGTSGAASEGKYFHKATAKNLKPNTEYAYSVSNDSINWSAEYKYKTPQTKTFKFAAIGDPQIKIGEQDIESNWFSPDKSVALGWKTTVERITAANVDFILSTGDQVDSGSNEEEYEKLFAPSELKSIPMAPSVGNHDRHQIFQYHFNLPNEQNFPEENYGNYFYLYNNILFVALNTSAYVESTEDAKPYIEYFDATLSAADAMYSGKYKWLIVQHHKSTRSVAWHSAEKDIQYYMDAGFEKLMEKYKVDFVLAGHDHVYARINLGGIYYITLNTASGIKYYGANEPLPANTYAQQNRIPGYTIFEVNGNNISVSVYEVDKDVPIDKFEVEK
ncbi:MAG: metallophosphoesterase family protein [Fibromonadaceae bacterium]|nr:metallophosphoesterase family protein [Fibromonadaceae bacterium]